MPWPLMLKQAREPVSVHPCARRKRRVGTELAFAVTVGLAALLVSASFAGAQVTFSQATEDRDVYLRHPNLYDKEPGFPGQLGAQELYLAKRPAFSVPVDAIVAVVVDRQPVLRTLDAVLDYLKNGQARESIRGRYVLTLYLNRAHSKSVAGFLNGESGRLVAIRINGQILTIVSVAGPFLDQELIFDLTDSTPDRLKHVLAPLGSRVVWK